MATPEGTERYFARMVDKKFPEHAIRRFGKTGLQVSSIGFGGYRVHYNSIEHARALRYALLNGINLIDTSSNYTDGGSEMLVGNLLQEMFERDELKRDEVTVVSKVGYVQGRNLQLAQRNEADGQPFPEMVKYMEGCWHCIHPDFLEMQLSMTLERLRLSALDIYLLHNPEYYLSDRKHVNGGDREAARSEYYRRIRQAFAWMEEKVAEGKFKAYGISSNTFPYPADHFEFTSLEQTLALAREVASNHYFRVVQFPFNLFEIGAVTEENQRESAKSFLKLAQENELATLVNRPLNASFEGSMVRLASFRESKPKEVLDEFHKKLTSVQRLEQQFKTEMVSKLPEQGRETLSKVFSLGAQLQEALSLFESWEHWDHVKQNIVMPQTFSALQYVAEQIKNDAEVTKWSESYANTLMQFLDAISRHYENDAQERTIKLAGKLKSLEPELASSETLSQMALRVLTSVPGIDCVLLGMRRTPYVEDALQAMKAAPLSAAKDVLIDFNQS